jgi:DNA repair photolyase
MDKASANVAGTVAAGSFAFDPRWIVLTRGCTDTPERRAVVERVVGAFPDAEVVERFDKPHNRIDLGPGDPLAMHRRGKRTLVLAVHGSAVRRSEEAGNTCPNYWHFSPYGFCPYGCHYCYLAGTPGVWFSPTVKVYVNLSEILAEIDGAARRLDEPTAFYLGKLQDGLALDGLTGYSRQLVPFFAEHATARMIVLTKSAGVDNLLDLDHRGRTILSWSLNPPEVVHQFEANTPQVEARIEAMRRCAAAGYPVRAVIMPIIPVANWRDAYARFIDELLAAVPLVRITLGGICSYAHARRLMDAKLGRANPISRRLDEQGETSPDGRSRYAEPLRVEMYDHLIHAIRRRRPDLEIALCLEECRVFEALGLTAAIGRCNCVL